jgi:hypothetical protein
VANIPVTVESNSVEDAARQHCRRLLKGVKRDSREEALVILAFTFGAAWALDRPDMIALAEAQMDARRAGVQA